MWPWTHEIPCCVHLLVTWQGPTATAAAPCLAKDLLLLHAVGAGAPVVDPVGTEVLSPPPPYLWAQDRGLMLNTARTLCGHTQHSPPISQ